MDMTPIDTRTARLLDGNAAVTGDRPLSSAELAVGLLYAMLFVPVLLGRMFLYVLGGQIAMIGRALKVCAEELARARRT